MALFSPKAKADSDGHVLDALWKQYQAAYNSDQPQKEQEILTKIKEEAGKQRLAWDYYDAVTRYEDVGVRINWKMRESLHEATKEAIAEFNEPVVTYYFSLRNAILPEDFLGSNADRLKSANNPEFHKRDWAVKNRSYSKTLLENFQNDYDYVVWSLYMNSTDKTAQTAFKGRYPLEQLVEFEDIESDYTYWRTKYEDRAAALDAFTEKYKDKAVSLLSRQARLNDIFRKNVEDEAEGKKYEELKALCEAFEKDRKASPEKTLAESCTEVKDLLNTLNSKHIGFELKDSQLKVFVRNLASVDLEIKTDKKTVHKASLTNPKCSFYAQDTISYKMPAIDDGEYTVICKNGDEKQESRWELYTISVVTKYDADGWWAYAADYQSGEPVKGYEKGFQKISAKDKFSVSINENGRTRRSREVKLRESSIGPYSIDKRLEAILLTDRAAFNPEETVQYKVILFRMDYSLEAVGAGQKVKVRMNDAKGEKVAEEDLTTNEFGSVAGSFFIPRGERNGSYTIEVEVDGRVVESRAITVDDFVLPTFAVSFDRHDPVQAGENVVFSGTLKAYSGHSIAGADVSYRISKWGDVVSEGKLELNAGGRFEVGCATEPTSYQSYVLTIKVVDGTGETKEFNTSAYVRYTEPEAEKQKEYFFENLGDDNHIGIRAVAGDQPVWALVDFYGLDSRLIETRFVRFNPKGGGKAEKSFTYEYLKEYPDALTLSVFYFQNARQYSYTTTLRRKDTRYDLPLEFTRFLDTTAPGQSYEFLINTAPGVECAATIFDKSSETVRANGISIVRPYQYPVYGPRYNSMVGSDRASAWFDRGRVYYMKSATTSMVMLDAAVDDMAENEAMVEDAVAMGFAAPQAEETEPEIAIREDMSTTIAWVPFLRSDENGNISFKFTNADKLSTFYVQLFAHDKAMRNATLRKEMVVTLPVKVSVLEARYLYPEDRWRVRVSLSSSVDHEINGTLTVNGNKISAAIPAFEQVWAEVPVFFDEDDKELILTAVFQPENDIHSVIPREAKESVAGDAVRVRIPIKESWQTITEAHSEVLLAGDDKDALIADLRSRFVNIDGSEATLKEISIKQMLEEALPEHFNIDSENCITLMRALYAATLAKSLGSQGLTDDELQDVVKRLLDCRNSDGGFGWFKEFDSSPIITATMLDYCAGIRTRGLELPAALADVLPAAVSFLDAKYFSKDPFPFWRGGISMEQYIYIRCLYPEVKFAQKTDAKWRKEARKYLVPTKDRGLQYSVFAKARRMKTLQALLESDGGLELARRLGISLGVKCRLRKSLAADTRSLVQYAVKHRTGATYYPNAVMPWRGLLESELYAHSLICDLLASLGETEIAEGIRLWLMLQKETQQWGADPGTVNALASVRDASPETLETMVIALSGTARLPFAQIKAAGNGFTIERGWYKLADDGTRSALSEGDTLTVGDKVIAVCPIWNEENRSFIHISIPRPACLTPKNQLSSFYGWNAWRSVGIDRTEYWFESYPEEKTTIEEVFYVTQSGLFHAGVPEIESLYAPHYRANGESGIEIATKSR